MAFSAPTRHDRKVPPAGQLDVNHFWGPAFGKTCSRAFLEFGHFSRSVPVSSES